MMKKLAFVAVAVVLAVASLSQAAATPSPDMVLTIDYATGAATIKNVGTVAHHIDIYQIKSAGPNPTDNTVAAYLTPGTRASTDPISGDPIPADPNGWKGICDDLVTDLLATLTRFGFSVSSYGPIMSSNPIVRTQSISEGTLTGGAYANFATTATPYSIGKIVQPGMASLTDLSFFWHESGEPSATKYSGPIVIVPEPATMCVLALGGVATLLRKRRRA
ncbi:MAG: PEP-CTERM sorting domain-containing protein [Planctomycetota bacterium]|nr:PEP-CTERM sorting domain-containing protein [Planctomycetota bacterium]